MEIAEALEQINSRFRFGDIYTALDLLTRAQYLERKLGQAEPERGGRARNYYRPTPRGTRAYDNTKTVSRSSLTRRHQKPAPIVA